MPGLGMSSEEGVSELQPELGVGTPQVFDKRWGIDQLRNGFETLTGEHQSKSSCEDRWSWGTSLEQLKWIRDPCPESLKQVFTAVLRQLGFTCC